MTPEISTQITNLRNLLDYNVSNFNSAEIQLKTILPDWINRASSLKLKGVLQKYLGFVEQHLIKMETFIESEQINSLNMTNAVMQSLIEETNEKLNHCTDPEVRDACLLACVQIINHYKISVYGTASAFANMLKMENFASAFHEAEVNEKQIDDRLSQLAEHEINIHAVAPLVLQK
jgi:ferritin-like metal-binding protein YciE